MRYDLEHMYRNPASYREAEFFRAATERGWVLERNQGSHQVFVKAGWPFVVTIPAGLRKNGTKRAVVRGLRDEEAGR